MEQSVMFECHFGVDANAEYVGGDAVPVGSSRVDCGLVSGFGHAEHGLQLRNGNCRVQGGVGTCSCATSDLDDDVACRYLGNGILGDIGRYRRSPTLRLVCKRSSKRPCH